MGNIRCGGNSHQNEIWQTRICFCRIVGNDGLYIAEGGLKAGNRLGVKDGLLLDFCTGKTNENDIADGNVQQKIQRNVWVSTRTIVYCGLSVNIYLPLCWFYLYFHIL